MSNQEIIRREQFCQILQEINGSSFYLVVGIRCGQTQASCLYGHSNRENITQELGDVGAESATGLQTQVSKHSLHQRPLISKLK